MGGLGWGRAGLGSMTCDGMAAMAMGGRQGGARLSLWLSQPITVQVLLDVETHLLWQEDDRLCALGWGCVV